VAEEAGLITQLGAWGIEEACRQSRAWQDAGFQQIRIAVNVSSHQFRAGDLDVVLGRALEANGLDGSALSLELTEGVIMENPEEVAETLLAFKELGLEISIDDFGTGYSSLSYLSRFPLDELKIDRSFVNGVTDSSDDANDPAIVEAIISMARSLGLKVVAEGVETEEQLAFLKERGCDQYQGYLCSRPLPPAEWQALLERI
jgi:EAL domain-containing protein (putative c-di-GMP-specific phosphodiesterase class I)